MNGRAGIGPPSHFANSIRRNNMRSVFAAAALTCALTCALSWSLVRPSMGQSVEESIVRFPDDVVYKGLPGAPQHVTLIGDPSKPGLYVDRIKFAAGTKVMPHWHPDPARTVLVMSGTFYFAVGESWDESKLKAYPAGTLYSEPPGTAHYAWAKDGDVVLQVTAIGPTGNTPVQRR
jgi:quercetin dioxygenase-like cupin family protein